MILMFVFIGYFFFFSFIILEQFLRLQIYYVFDGQKLFRGRCKNEVYSELFI